MRASLIALRFRFGAARRAAHAHQRTRCTSIAAAAVPHFGCAPHASTALRLHAFARQNAGSGGMWRRHQRNEIEIAQHRNIDGVKIIISVMKANEMASKAATRKKII